MNRPSKNGNLRAFARLFWMLVVAISLLSPLRWIWDSSSPMTSHCLNGTLDPSWHLFLFHLAIDGFRVTLALLFCTIFSMGARTTLASRLCPSCLIHPSLTEGLQEGDSGASLLEGLMLPHRRLWHCNQSFLSPRPLFGPHPPRR